MAKGKKEDLKEFEEQAIAEDEIDVISSGEQDSETDQEIDLEKTEEEVGVTQEVPAEIEAINTDTEVVKEVEEKETKSAKKATKTKTAKRKKIKSKLYLKATDGFEATKTHSIEDAAKLVKKLSYSKFDGTISLAIRLKKSKKGDDAVRGTIKLPHGAGRELRVAVADEKLIEEVRKGKLDFDILVATPAMMHKLGVVAKILGPKGKMPNPKDGTVVEDPKSAVADLAGNIVRYRQDLGGNIHLPVGKVSFDEKKISENISAVFKALAHLKKESATLSPTMGAGIRLEV